MSSDTRIIPVFLDGPAPQGAPAPAAPAPAKPGGGGRLRVLDLLRFVAAGCVLGYHFLVDTKGAWGADGPPFQGAAPLFRYGWMGVEFFFVISGFVICMSCWGRSLSDFFASRVTRLVPAYLFSVLFLGGLLMLFPLKGGRPPLTDIIVNSTMLQQFVGVPNLTNVYWTLAAELKFYILFSVVVALGINYRRTVLFCALWTVGYLFAAETHYAPLVAILQPDYAPYFVTGIGLYLVHRFGSTLLSWGIVLTSMAISVSALVDRVDGQNHGRPHPIVSSRVALAILVCFFVLMALIALGKLGWMTWGGMTTLGALTFPLYLLHMHVGQVVVTRLHGKVPGPVLVLLLVAVVLLLAYAVHKLVERPLGRILRTRLKESFARVRQVDAAA